MYVKKDTFFGSPVPFALIAGITFHITVYSSLSVNVEKITQFLFFLCMFMKFFTFAFLATASLTHSKATSAVQSFPQCALLTGQLGLSIAIVSHFSISAS